MKTDDELEALVSAWMRDAGALARPGYLADVLEITRTTRQRPTLALVPARLAEGALSLRPAWWGSARFALLVAAAALVLLVVGLALVAGSRPPVQVAPALHHNGVVVYDAGGVLYLAKPDGSEPVQLTSSDRFSAEPAFSPDGSLLAYVDAPAYRDNLANVSLAIRSMADGRTTRIALPPIATLGACFCERWSPDGTKIAFMAQDYRDGAYQFPFLYIVNRDGSDLRRLDLGPSPAWYPAWSPDSTAIVFTALMPGGPSTTWDATADLFTMDIDGTDTRKLTTERNALCCASWLPDGRIVYLAAENLATYAWIVNADGSGAHRLTSGNRLDRSVIVSPDGRLAAITQANGAGEARLTVTRLDGLGESVLDTGPIATSQAVWSPDQTKLLANLIPAAQQDGTYLRQPVLVDVNGGAPARLSALLGRTDAPTTYPGGSAWQPGAPWEWPR